MTGLLDALVDDAGLFPPTSLDLRSAVRRHLSDLAGGEPMLTHRFVCPASRIGDLAEELSAGETRETGETGETAETGVRVILVGGDDPAVTREAIHRVAGTPRLTLGAVEWAPGLLGPSEPEAALRAALHVLAEAGAGSDVPLLAEPSGITEAAEMTAAIVASRAVADRPVGLKLRCGGVRPDLFPPAPLLAAALVAAAGAGVPVKATAGLHHAVRHADPATGFTHYGFLNVLLASARAQRGGTTAEVAAVLLDEDTDRLVAFARSVGTGEIPSVRAGFVSYGSCSTSTPILEAAGLGLSSPTPTTGAHE